MSFPLRVGDRAIASPPALARAVREDAAAGGGQLLAGQRPRQWVPALVRTRLLTRDMAVGLVAALLQDPRPSTLVEAAHLALALGDARLGTLLSTAVEAHDVGVLLVPGEEGRSVEDQLLLAAAALAPHDEAEARGKLLEQLRHAGLAAAELAVLARGGSADEVRTWLPALLQEPLEDGAALAQLLIRAATRAPTVAALLELDEPARRAAWNLAREADKRVATDATLRSQLLSRFASQRAKPAR